MNIGNLKHPITIIDYTETESANGFKSKSWNEIKKTWADITAQKQSMTIENEKDTVEETLIFTIRYQDIDLKKRLRYQEKDYQILSIEDKTFEKRFLSIEAKGVK